MTPDYQGDVKKFMEVMGQEVPTLPTCPDERLAKLRADLIHEEAREFKEAVGLDGEGEVDLNAAADAIADILYVTFGAAIALGIDIGPVWDIVQRCNMAKAGGPIREDGKRLKPEGWVPPDAEIAEEIQRQSGVRRFEML